MAPQAIAAATGSVTDNGNGSVTVTYSTTGDDVLLLICPSGTVTCDMISASYKMGTNASLSQGPLTGSPTTVAAGTNVVIGFGPGGGPLPAGAYVFALFGDPGTGGGAPYNISGAGVAASITAGGGGGGGGSTPTPAVPPSAPGAASAQAGSGEATVSWTAPASQGSFPVSNYQVQASPSGKGCLVPATATTCRIAGLRNGTTYTFSVRALNGGGWGAWADAGTVTPSPEPDASIVITGSRSGDARVARVAGQTTGLEVAVLQSMVRLSTRTEFTSGSVVQVDSTGEFAWKRRVAPSVGVQVYFTAGELTSNTVTIAATR